MEAIVRKETILYKVHDGLYVNLTNRCPCACTFCLRQDRDRVGESDSLWLEHEPSFEEVRAALQEWDVKSFPEIVFCGFGEPTEAFDVLKETAAFIKAEYGKPIRINTNGLGSLVNGRDIAPELEGLVDTVSISLNTPDPERYFELVRPKFGPGSFDAMLSFAEECVKYVPKVVLTTVSTTLTKEEEARCAEICRRIGAVYRIRTYEGPQES